MWCFFLLPPFCLVASTAFSCKNILLLHSPEANKQYDEIDMVRHAQVRMYVRLHVLY
jgi:hypothetical protein